VPEKLAQESMTRLLTQETCRPTRHKILHFSGTNFWHQILEQSHRY